MKGTALFRPLLRFAPAWRRLHLDFNIYCKKKNPNRILKLLTHVKRVYIFYWYFLSLYCFHSLNISPTNREMKPNSSHFNENPMMHFLFPYKNLIWLFLILKEDCFCLCTFKLVKLSNFLRILVCMENNLKMLKRKNRSKQL